MTSSVPSLVRRLDRSSPARCVAGCASVLLFAPSQMGCASAVWHPRVESVAGEYKNTTAATEKAEATVEGEADDVKAIVMELPQGMKLNGEVLEVDTNTYEVLGKVSAKPAGEFFYPYREDWRRPVCYPQRVLTIATLYIWTIVPTSWPCFISSGTVEERRDRIVEAMKRATKAMGGNMVLVGGFGGTVTVSATSKTSAVVSTMEATEGVGWAIRVRAVPATPAAPPAAVNATSL